MKLGSKEIDLIELILMSFYLVLGIVFIAIDFPLRNQLLLPVSAILLGILMYDLNIPKRIVGIGEDRQFRIFVTILGAIIPFLVQTGFFGFVTMACSLVSGIIFFTVRNWRKIDWNGKGRIQHLFRESRKKELEINPEFDKTRVVVLGWKTVSAVDFLRILSLMSLITQGVSAVFILSFLVIIVGNTFVMEASLFALLTIWILVTSFRLLRKRKWKRLWDKMEKLEEDVWLSTIQQFSTLRGAYYFSFFIPSLLFAIVGTYVGLVVFPLLIAAPLSGSMSNANMIFRWFVSIAILWAWVLATIYPFYVTVKLFQAVVTGKRMRLLKFPLLCLSLSTSFSFVLQFSSNVSNIAFFNLVTLDVLIMVIITLMLLVAWGGVIWMWIHRRYTKMNPVLERNLAVVMTIFSLPLYGFLGAVLILVLIFGILGLVIMFRLISLPLMSREAELKTLVAGIAYLGGISFFVFFVVPEQIWVTILAATGIVLLLILLSPKIYRSRIIKVLFRTYELKEDKS